MLEKRKSEAIPIWAFLRMGVSFLGGCGHATANLSLLKEKIQKLVDMARELRGEGTASLASLQKLAQELRLAQAAVMGRLGRAALKPNYGHIAKGGVAVSRTMERCLKWRGDIPPTEDPRLIMSSKQGNPQNPVTIFSDATGGGGLATLRFLPMPERPVALLLRAQANRKLRNMAVASKKIYIFEIFAEIATVCQLRDALWGRKVILSAGNEAVRVALTKGASKNVEASTLVSTSRA